MSQENDQKERFLAYAAGKAGDTPYFLASALEIYKQREKLNDADLCAFLGIETAHLSLLALCRRPDPTTGDVFRQEVKTICAKFGLPVVPLLNLLRRVAAYETTAEAETYLMAARDKEEGEDD